MNAVQKSQSVTEFVRDPNKVLKKIDKGDIILRRTKGRPSIRITLASRAESAESGLEVLSRALEGVVQSAREQPSESTLKPYPWTKFLSPDERERFSRELLETLVACVSISNFAPLKNLVNGWKSTAEIYADPELAARLREPAPAHSGKRVARP
jgi:hypothetical protein